MDVDIDRGDRSALGCSHFGGQSTEEGTQRRAAAGCELALCSTCSTRSVEPRSGRRGSPNDRGSSVVDSVADSALQQLSFQQAGCGGRPDSTADGWRGRFSSGRRRRGYGRAKPRGCRSGIRCRQQSAKSGDGPQGIGVSSATVAGFSSQRLGSSQEAFSLQGQETQEVKEKEQKGAQAQEEVQEEPREFQLITFQQQQQSIPFSEQFKQFEHQETIEMEGGRKVKIGELQRFGTCGPAQVQEEGRFGGLCGEAPRGLDSPLFGRRVHQAVKGNSGKVIPASGCVSDQLGSPVCRSFRASRHEGSPHTGGDLGPCESSRDSQGIGRVGATDLGYTSCQDEGWIMGKSRGHRVGQHQQNASKLKHASFDQRLSQQLWGAWSRLGGGHSECEGFNSFFGRAMEALVGVFRRPGRASEANGLSSRVSHIFDRLHGYGKRDGTLNSYHRTAVGSSPDRVFPLSPLSKGGRFWTQVQAQPCDDRAVWCGGNLIIGVLNYLHGGLEDDISFPSAAHQRVSSRMEETLRAHVLTDEPILSPMGVDAFLKQTQHYTGCGVVLALGVKGGVPQSAATVPLADHLRDLFPMMSRQVECPDSVLLSVKRRPKRVKRGYTWLASSYPELVKRNVKAGLHKLKRVHQVAKHRGIPCVAGAFAVAKDDKEDRVITDPSVNQLLDPLKIPRPKFAYIPHLRSTWVPKGGLIRVSKRDARHYFHHLRIGSRWQRWLCGPPIRLVNKKGLKQEWFPACRSTPMGFGPSAGWAQGLTDVVTHDAGLPQDRRVHPDFVVPAGLPVWGSIIDDIWAMEHTASDSQGDIGPSWLQQAETAWCLRGVEPNQKKSVDGAAGEEVQGYYVHPQLHWVGVSLEKRRFLFQATFHVLLQRRVLVAVIDRLVGKYGFAHSCRPCLRSIFVESYAWLDTMRSRRREWVFLPSAVWEELAIAMILLWFAEFDLSADWSNRVECTDASMTGLGRSWSVMPTNIVQTMARFSSHPTTYTNLKLPWGINLTETQKCPLRKIRLPHERVKWKSVGTPWYGSHITLSEADATCWAMEDRLRRPIDEGKRFVHPLDSAACVGAFTKGRSASHALNQRCRRACSINLAGGYDNFYPWIPSKENPADEPSRWFEPAGGCKDDEPELGSVDPTVEMPGLRFWGSQDDALFFIHLCSGPRRSGDLLDAIERIGALHGITIVGIAVDPLAEQPDIMSGVGSSRLSLLDSKTMIFLLSLIHSGKVAGGFSSPPCSTISAARHVPLSDQYGPRPLRGRDDPWIPLPGLTQRERRAVHLGSVLFLLCMTLLLEIRIFGGWVGHEHPADRGRDPYPSFFNTHVVHKLRAVAGLAYVVLDQCMFGASSKKPTGLLLSSGASFMRVRCKHDRKHQALIGRSGDGAFLTTPAARYPAELCAAVGSVFVNKLVAAQEKGYQQPHAVIKSLITFWGKIDPWRAGINVRGGWVEPCAEFLATHLKAIHHYQIYRGVAAAQQ